MKRLAAVVLVLFASAALAAPPELELPKEVTGPPGAFIPVPAKTAGKVVRWKAVDPGLNVFPAELLKDSRTAVVTAARPGRYRLWAVTAAGDEVSPFAEVVVVVGDAPPPPGPTPPGPTPPGPTPDPPAPAPEGFLVIFVYESGQALSPAAQQAMYGERVRAYLDARSKGYRRFDKDVDAADEKDADIKALWQAARPKVTTVPCVIVAVGGKAEILPLPAGEDAALELFRKYGG